MSAFGFERVRGCLGPVRWWNALAWILVAGGIGASIVGSEVWSRAVRSQAEQSFRAEAAGVGSTVTTALQRMNDLMVAARTLVETNPTLTNAELAAWYRSIGVPDRYRGTLGFGYVALVPAAELQRYEAVVRADPVPSLPRPGRTLQITPPGPRATYCLIRLAVAGTVAQLIPGAGFDLCAVPGANFFLAPLDAGRISTVAASLPGTGQTLIVSAPIYRGGEAPATEAARRSQALGWMVGLFDVNAVLGGAVAEERDLAVSISRQGQAGDPLPASSAGRLSSVATVGQASADTAFRSRFVLEADGRWIVTVTGSPRWDWLSPTRQRVALLAGGILACLLAFALVQALGRGRGRALRMIAEKTSELHHQALHDSLTGLPNRTLVLDRTSQMLARAARQHTIPSALFIDIDGFKHVNDTFGHAAGDAVLRVMGSRLSKAVRAADTVGRLGGDEFIVLFDSATLDASPELVAERILEVLREPIHLDGATERPITITASIGIATGLRKAEDELIRDADIALYRAKKGGKNRYVLFESTMQTAAIDYLTLEMDLRDALEEQQLFLLYQPIFDLRNEAVTGVEALLRWRHPTRGVIQPDTFIPIAENSGLIVPIGRWVLGQACRQAVEWNRKGHEIGVAVNISGRQLEHDDFVLDVHDALESSRLDPERLTLEITETALMHDTEAAKQRLVLIKALGVRIAIDDFGSGYSSLAYLRQFPVDALKIDRSFISGIAESKESAALVHTLVQLGKTLGLQTLGEGIEEREQLQQLRREHCDLGQGFLFARPLQPGAIEQLLTTVSADTVA